MIQEEIEEFLIIGSDDISSSINSECSNIEKIYQHSQHLLQQYHEMKEKDQKLREVISVKSKEMESDYNLQCLFFQDLKAKYSMWLQKQYEVKLYKTHIELSRLASCLNENNKISDIPELIINIFNNCPRELPFDCFIRKRLVSETQSLNQWIIQDFHLQFESQLQASSNAEQNEAFGVEKLESFFQNSKSWLLACTLTGLLPLALSESANSQCMQKYEEILDSCLTPLWGRFHYYLKSSREMKSKKHIMWTFSFAKTFIELVMDICNELSCADQLNLIYVGEYKSIGNRYVLEKAMKFMRLHLVSIFELFLEDISDTALVDETSQIIMSSVECSLEFDHQMNQLYSYNYQSNCNSTISLSSCIYDIKTIHSMWVESDIQFFHQQLRENIIDKSYESLFITKFGSDLLSETERIVGDIGDLNISYSGYRCYQCLYHCLRLFHLACSRYHSYLAVASQDIFSLCILEPLLLLSVGLLVFRIRTNETLYQISQQRNSIENSEDNFSTLQEYMSSIQYFQTSLQSLHDFPHYRQIQLRQGRFEDRFVSIQAWMPKKFNPRKTYSIEELVQISFVVPGFENKVTIDDKLGIQGLGAFVSNRKSSQSTDSNLGDVVDLARGKCEAITSVLESLFQENMSI